MAERPDNPVVSVVMPVYNAERYVARAVESVLGQTFGDFEFVIIDDGSTDGSKEILRELAEKDGRVRLVRRGNTGYAVALNEGLGMARGEFVARMDADDVSEPGRFARQVAFLRGNAEVVAVGGQVVVIDPDGDEMYRMECPVGHEEIDGGHILGLGGRIVHPAVMFRREAVLGVGGYRVEMEPAEDLDLWLRLAEVGRLANVEEVVLKYRVHLKNVSIARSGEQVTKTGLVVAEARGRRGMSEVAGAREEEAREVRERDVLWMWARRAYRSGNYRVARKHARAAVRVDPGWPGGWRILAGAYLGKFGRPVYRLMGGR